jgi:AcrR family transcriptional regulator
MKIARGEGVAAINMRRVAKELGVSARLLYRHVEDKAEMVALLADEVTCIAMPDVSGCTWEEKLRVVVSSSPQVYSQFPGISAAILSQSLKPLHWPHALRLRTAIPGSDDR